MFGLTVSAILGSRVKMFQDGISQVERAWGLNPKPFWGLGLNSISLGFRGLSLRLRVQDFGLQFCRIRKEAEQVSQKSTYSKAKQNLCNVGLPTRNTVLR